VFLFEPLKCGLRVWETKERREENSGRRVLGKNSAVLSFVLRFARCVYTTRDRVTQMLPSGDTTSFGIFANRKSW